MTQVTYTGSFPTLPECGYLKKGDSGSEVKKIQKFLNWYQNSDLLIDGEYGKNTKVAVSKFQIAMGMKGTGTFGALTLKYAKDAVKIINENSTAFYQGTMPSLKVTKTRNQVINDAIMWGRFIVNNNDFHYGHGTHSHHNGCYFCGTQPAKKKTAGIKNYQYTYCCNPFIGACWAHGGGIPQALKLCKKGSSWGFLANEGYSKSSLFNHYKRSLLAKSKLKAGDVLCNDHHAAMYIGNGYIMEAGSEDDNKVNSIKWNYSIRIRELTSSNYKNFKRVHRLKEGYTSTSVIEFGEYSDRVKLLQKYLNWYGNFNLTVDGFFGKGTLSAVKNFQKKESLTIDGVFGSASLIKAASIKK